MKKIIFKIIDDGIDGFNDISKDLSSLWLFLESVIIFIGYLVLTILMSPFWMYRKIRVLITHNEDTAQKEGHYWWGN